MLTDGALASNFRAETPHWAFDKRYLSYQLMSGNHTNFKAIHLFIQEHFGWDQSAYTVNIINDRPGLRIEKDGNLYQLETLAEREAISREQLATLGQAMWVPSELAVQMLTGSEGNPDFLERLLNVLEEEAGTSPQRLLARKAEQAFENARQQMPAVPFWETISTTDAELLGAGLVALNQLAEDDTVSKQLADLYINNSHVLCEIQDGDALQGTVDGVTLLIYEVW